MISRSAEIGPLREAVIGLMVEANKLQHFGVDYMVKRSTLSDANNRQGSQFFRDSYKHFCCQQSWSEQWEAGVSSSKVLWAMPWAARRALRA